MVNWLNNIIEGIPSGYKFNLLKKIVEILLIQAVYQCVKILYSYIYLHGKLFTTYF